jgi:hypothetical protein
LTVGIPFIRGLCRLHRYRQQQHLNTFRMNHQIRLEFRQIFFLAHRPLDLPPRIFYFTFQLITTPTRSQTRLVFLDFLPECIDCSLTLCCRLPKRNDVRMLYLVKLELFGS